jgi:hypothetical protein
MWGARVSRFAQCPILVAAIATLALPAPLLTAADGALASRSPETPSLILIGFAGGFVRHDSPHHEPVQLAQSIRRTLPKNAYIQVFENRHRKTAYKTILRLLDSNHDGILTDEEKARARIILFGHSWGASAVVLLARELNRVGIPVLLTVQVDSVAKFWQNDSVIPGNVAEAVNFYQPHGLLHGRAQITAADPSRTQILGNFRFDYRKEPISCEGAPRLERLLAPGHMQSECDPRLWAQVGEIVRQHLEPQPSAVAAIPTQ